MDQEDVKLYQTLEEVLENPESTKPPTVLLPYLAWEERVTLLAAREKGGKSTLASAAVAAASAGTDFLGEQTHPSKMLWISLEEHISEIATRFVAFGANPKNVYITNGLKDVKVDIPEIIEEVSPDLIVWDTLGALANYYFPHPIEPGDSSKWTKLMQWVLTLTREHKAASLVLHHARKSDGRYRDSTAIGANVDVILEMFGEADSPRKIKGVGRWMIPEASVSLRNGGFVLLDAEKKLREEILAYVEKHPGCSTRDIREAVTGRVQEINRVKDSLEKEGLLKNEGSEQQHAYRRIRKIVQLKQ